MKKALYTIGILILIIFLWSEWARMIHTSIPLAPDHVLKEIDEVIVYGTPPCEYRIDCFKFIPKKKKMIYLADQSIRPYRQKLSQYWERKSEEVSPNHRYELRIDPEGDLNNLYVGIYDLKTGQFDFINTDHHILEPIGWSRDSRFYFYRTVYMDLDDELYLLSVFDTITKKSYRVLENPVHSIDFMLVNE